MFAYINLGPHRGFHSISNNLKVGLFRTSINYYFFCITIIPFAAIAAEEKYPIDLVVEGVVDNTATNYTIHCSPPNNERLICEVKILSIVQDWDRPNTCFLTALDWKEEFTRRGESEWVRNSGPHNTCETIVITRLFQEPYRQNPSEMVWVYENQNIDTADGEHCRKGEVIQHRYDIDQFFEQAPLKMFCTYIDIVPR